MKRDEIIAKWAELGAREKDAWVESAVFGGETFGQFREVNGVRVLIPNYTTDISAAWAVLDFVRLNYTVQLDDKESGNWTLSIRYGTWKATAASAPEAICLASIIAELTEVSVDVAV